jgi:hypothetical protein
VIARTLKRRFTLSTPDRGVYAAIRFLECDPDITGPAPQEVAVAIEPWRSHYRILQDGAVLKEVLGARATVEFLHVHLFRCSIEELPEAALLHAASLRYGDRRLLLAGSKSAGKTTFALRLLQFGYEIESDEHVFIDRTAIVARPRGCRVKASGLPMLVDMAKIIATAPSYTDDTVGTIFNVDPRTLGSTWRIEHGHVDLVIVLQPNHGGFSSIRALQPSALVQLLMSEIGLRDTARGATIAALAAMATRSKAFDLSLGDHTSATHCLKLALDA